MRYITYSILLLTLLSSCSKHNIGPNSTDGNTTQTDNTPGPVGYDIKGQTVKLGIYNNNLLMNYTEKITLLINPDSLKGSYNVIFNEDLSKSKLADFNFTTATAYGTIVTNYLDNNLNNITLDLKKDTTINGQPFTKISFSRFLYFNTPYANYNAAFVEYQYLLTQKDTLKYSSYITYPTRTSKVSTVKVGLTYTQ